MSQAGILQVFLPLLLAWSAVGQTLPRFEVATVKLLDTSHMNTMGIRVDPGGHLVISAFSLKTLIGTAFNVGFWQISGGEDWTKNVEYVVEGVPPEDMRGTMTTRHSLFTVGDERLRQMLQALLIERFQLKFHMETKTGSTYILKRSKAPLLLVPRAGTSSNGTPDAEPAGSMGWAERWALANTTMHQLARFASDYELHAPVLDQTGLTGSFDYRSPHEDPETYRDDPTASFLRMIASVGLKLESGKGPVETFVIDQAIKPAAN